MFNNTLNPKTFIKSKDYHNTKPNPVQYRISFNFNMLNGHLWILGNIKLKK